MKFHLDLKIGLYALGVKFYKEATQFVVGVNSNLFNTGNWWEHHILMIDYDDVLSLANLRTELERLIKKFELGDVEIYESSYRHYFVFFFYEDMDYFDALRVIHDTACCKEFKRWRMDRNEMTLRLTPKNFGDKQITFIENIRSPNRFDWKTHKLKYLTKEQKQIRDTVHTYAKVIK